MFHEIMTHPPTNVNNGPFAYEGLTTTSFRLMSVYLITVLIKDVSPTMSVCLISVYS